jgi:predicted helicase
VRAIRWASDRIGDAGIIGFVTNAGFVDANTTDGLRKCLADEFSSLYVFHLRGNARTSGETRRKEKDNVFGMGSRAPIAISLLVKNPDALAHGQIHFHDIGDYLSREEKLERIAGYTSLAGIEQWRQVTPDEHGDWLKQRDDRFAEYLVLGNKAKASEITIFDSYSNGVKTNRDAWVYNASQKSLVQTMEKMIGFYNSEVDRYSAACEGMSKQEWPDPDAFVDFDSTKMSWTREVKQDLARQNHRPYRPEGIVKSLYRPFSKNWMYFDKHFNNCVYQMPRIFPNANADNLVIGVSAAGDKVAFSALISRYLPSLHFVDIEGSQCFPLYLYDVATQASKDDLFAEPVEGGLRRRDAITDAGMAHFQSAYPGEQFSKEDLFYYIYGILHSPDYRERYADNLSKELPRIPAVTKATDFWRFSKAGRALADLHLNYETVEPYPLVIESKGALTSSDYRVEKMKFAKKGDKTKVIYNHRITLKDIPEAAWNYVVNGKPALGWVMERQAVRTDKASGIVNDANDWATETMGNPKYPLELFQRVITVSLETQKVVNSLPALDIA